jgi:hypothetical protein
MSGRRIAQALVALGLIGFAVLMVRNTRWEYLTVRTPPEGEALTNPYYSLEHFLSAVGVQTREIHTLRDLPPHAALYVSNLRVDFAHIELQSLESWVESGGRLVIPGYMLSVTPALQRWSAITPVHRERSAAERRRPGAPPMLFPRLNQNECSDWSAQARGSASTESLCIGVFPMLDGYASHRAPLWSLTAEDHGLQLLRIAIDQGELTVIGPTEIATNQSLIQHDHARAWLEATGLKRGDTLLLLSAARAEALPLLIWRLAAPAIVLILIALLALIVRHWPRFGPAEPDPVPVRRSLAEQIHASARFAWRTHRLKALRAAVRRALDERARRLIVGYAKLEPRAQARALARLTGLDPGALQAALTVDAGGARGTQLGALALLESARRALHPSLHHGLRSTE